MNNQSGTSQFGALPSIEKQYVRIADVLLQQQCSNTETFMQTGANSHKQRVKLLSM